MDKVCNFITPTVTVDYGSFFSSVLSVSGVLFGLSFTALLFVIQSGFSSFKYSRRMFLELYVHFGTGLLTGLAYLTIISLLAQHAWDYRWLVNGTYIFFMWMYLQSMFRHQSHVGYIHTIHSTRFVPRNYGELRTFFRYITNLGVVPTFILLVIALFIVGYPVLGSYCDNGEFGLTKSGLYFSALIILAHSLLKVTRFIPEFFEISNQELDFQAPSSEEGDPNINYFAEKEAYKKYLEGHEYLEIGILNKKAFLDGTVWIEILSDERSEIWTNIHINVNNITPELLCQEVCQYAYELLVRFVQSRVDVNSIVLSFHVSIEGDSQSSRNLFFRSNRSEFSSIMEDQNGRLEFPGNMKNVLLNELFRGFGSVDA